MNNHHHHEEEHSKDSLTTVTTSDDESEDDMSHPDTPKEDSSSTTTKRAVLKTLIWFLVAVAINAVVFHVAFEVEADIQGTSIWTNHTSHICNEYCEVSTSKQDRRRDEKKV